jgi:hypothetical protein
MMSYGDRLIPGNYLVHSRFQRVSNFLNGHNMVSLVEPSIGSGPFNIVIEDCDFSRVNQVIIGQTTLHLDTLSLEYNPVLKYDSAIPVPDGIDIKTFQNNLHLFKDILITHSPSSSLGFLLNQTNDLPGITTFERNLRERFIASRRMIDCGNIIEAVSMVKGLGIGLTPSGDDLIAGLLIALHVQQRIYSCDYSTLIEDIYTCAKNSNPLSTAFLRSAKEGRVFEKLKYTMTALFDSNPENLLSRTLALLTVGATSGADMAVGLILGLENIKPYGN